MFSLLTILMRFFLPPIFLCSSLGGWLFLWRVDSLTFSFLYVASSLLFSFLLVWPVVIHFMCAQFPASEASLVYLNPCVSWLSMTTVDEHLYAWGKYEVWRYWFIINSRDRQGKVLEEKLVYRCDGAESTQELFKQLQEMRGRDGLIRRSSVRSEKRGYFAER